MSTRSSVGFHVDGRDILMYCQNSGYPTYMGEKVFKDILKLKKRFGWKKLRDKVENLRCVHMHDDPTSVDMARYEKYYQNVNSGKGYYALLRDLQGDLPNTIKAGIICCDNNFIHNSVMCEWAYIVNLDTKRLEIYKGFQITKPKGRYNRVRKYDGYYACSLIDEIDLTNGAEILAVILSCGAYWEHLEGAGNG